MSLMKIGEIAKQKVTEIEDKIRSLQKMKMKMKRSLKKVISQCESRDSIGDCPLLEGIDNIGMPNTSEP